jgi:hypothetical protein
VRRYAPLLVAFALSYGPAVIASTWDELASAPAQVTSKEWHTLALKAEGDRLSVALDEQPLPAATDMTFPVPGSVALCTNADSVTRFDRLDIKPLP